MFCFALRSATPGCLLHRHFLSLKQLYPPLLLNRIPPVAFVQSRSFNSSSVSLNKKHLESVGESLIPVINKLQEIFAITGMSLDLPQIVVIGGQSSGKSSVLENLVGRDFLPRGTDIVTRRPLVLQLLQIPTGDTEYGEFLHQPGKKFDDFQKIKAEIEAETNRVAGTNKGISNKPILLKIYSPNVLPLTLVDTPGITRVAIGDQPSNIEEQIRKLVSGYINKNNAVILAVQPANQDLATSDALSLAKTADSDGSRTIGVLTKLDLMDKGTDAMSILLGRTFPLRRGWTAIINRSQADIQADKSIISSQAAEDKFFRDHPVYRTIADRCGSKVLAQKCNKMLTEHIRKTLPSLRKQIDGLIQQREQELELYGEPVDVDPASAGWQLLQLLTKIANQYREAIEGENLSQWSNGKVTLGGGARIRYIFHEGFTKILNDVNPTIGLTTRDIQTAIKNAAGSKPALFVPDAAFEVLAQRQIKSLREPSLQVAESVYNELLKIIGEIENIDLMRFWRLKDKVIDESSNILRKSLKETQAMINTTIDLEMAYINTSHPDFIGLKLLLSSEHMNPQEAKKYDAMEDYNRKKKPSSGGGLWRIIFGSKTEENLSSDKPDTVSYDEVFNNISERDKAQIRIIRQLLDSYFTIVKKNVQDRVTKIVMHCMVKNSINSFQKGLHKKIYKQGGGPSEFMELLQEAGDLATKRKICLEDLKALQKAKKVIQNSEVTVL